MKKRVVGVCVCVCVCVRRGCIRREWVVRGLSEAIASYDIHYISTG